MGNIDSANNSRQKRFAILALAATVVAVFLWIKLRSHPQMGPDEEVFRTVDALFTAVTAREPKLVADCELRLIHLKENEPKESLGISQTEKDNQIN